MCRAGDRLVTVNDTFVVFLPVAEVEELLSEGGATVAWLEVLYCTVLYCTILCTVLQLERPTVRAEFQARELARRQPSAREVMEAVAGGGVRELISDRYSIWSPRHYHW